MPNYDPELQTHFRLWLDGEEVPFPEGSARFVNGTIDPIDEAVSSRRTVNGTLRIQADPAFRKFRLTVSCTDAMLPALFGIDPRQVATVWSPVAVRERGNSPSRTPVPGSLASQDGWIEYRPVLTGYLTTIPSLSESEWQSDANWSLVFEESAVPEVYFVTLADADLVAVAPGGSLTFNVGVLAATNTGLPITFARVSGTLPPGTSLNASTGLISGAPTTAGLYTFTIRATSGGQTGDQTYSILVNAAAAPRVSFAAVAQQDYVAGTYMGLNLAPSVTVENSSGVPVFDIQGGSLPPGLTLSTGGVVFGTPTGFGPYAAQIRAIIPSGEFDTQTIAFDAAVPSVDLAPNNIVQVIEGGTVSLALAPLTTVLNTSAAAVYAVVSGALPAGVDVNTATGLISGTTTDVGVFSVVVRASAAGATDEQTYTIHVIQAILDREAIISGGTSASITSPQTDLWGTTSVYALFRSSGTLTVSRAGWITGYARGGGAPGGDCTATGQPGGGGGAGEYLEFRIWLEAGTYTVATAASAPAGSTFGNDTTITRDSDGLEILRAYGGSRGGNSNQAGVDNTNPGGSAGGGGGSGAVAPTGGAAAGLSAGRGTNGAAGANGGGGGGGGAMAAGTVRNGGASAGRRFGSFPAAGNGGGGGGVASGTAGTGGGAGAGRGGVGNANGTNAGAYSGSGGGGAGTTIGRTGGAGGSGEVLVWVRT